MSAGNDTPQEDHGLGREVVDASTSIADTYLVPSDVAKMESRQRAGTPYWVLAGAALILLGEQSALAFNMFTPVLSEVATEFHTGNVGLIMTTLVLASGVLAPLLTKSPTSTGNGESSVSVR